MRDGFVCNLMNFYKTLFDFVWCEIGMQDARCLVRREKHSTTTICNFYVCASSRMLVQLSF